jgi:signal peptide peptidase SppA
MKRSFPHVLAAFYGSAWAILPEKLTEIEAVLMRRVAGGHDAAPVAFDDGEFDAPPKDQKPYKMHGAAAVIPIHGTITPRPSVFASWSGGASAEGIGRAVEQAAADPTAEAIVLDIDSPGGSVFGLPEAAGKIMAARKAKPVYAVANHVAASAAYWLATQAHTITVTPAGQVGSVGVIWAHTDYSKFEEQLGRKKTYVTAGKFKAEGNPDNPLDPDAAAEMQRVVNVYYEQFVAGVAKGRGVKADRVKEQFGEGRMKLAEEAVGLRMADRVATLEQIVAEVNASRTAKTKRKVAADLARVGMPTA